MLRWIALLLCTCAVMAQTPGKVAAVYFWKAKPGKLDDYSRYVRDVAAAIDEEARKAGAFLSVTTFVSDKPDAPWTHMRVFVCKDREQLGALSKALDDAGKRLEPDEAKRKARAEYSATLRDAVGKDVVDVLE